MTEPPSDRSAATWERVVGVPPPDAPGAFHEVFRRFIFGEVWNRPHLSDRDRRIITLTVLALEGGREGLALHVRGALSSGDLNADELEELAIQLAAYAGGPRASVLASTINSETQASG